MQHAIYQNKAWNTEKVNMAKNNKTQKSTCGSFWRDGSHMVLFCAKQDP